jgi:hypothetical protein
VGTVVCDQGRCNSLRLEQMNAKHLQAKAKADTQHMKLTGLQHKTWLRDPLTRSHFVSATFLLLCSGKSIRRGSKAVWGTMWRLGASAKCKTLISWPLRESTFLCGTQHNACMYAVLAELLNKVYCRSNQ